MYSNEVYEIFIAQPFIAGVHVYAWAVRYLVEKGAAQNKKAN